MYFFNGCHRFIAFFVFDLFFVTFFLISNKKGMIPLQDPLAQLHIQ